METKDNSPYATLHSPFIKVAIVDDHRVVADGMEKIITESGIAVLMWKAGTIAACREILKSGQPDVLMLDIGLPDGSGMDLCPLLKTKYPAMNILMLTGYAEYTVIAHVINNGAAGYILKNAMPEEIMEGIRTVAAGKRFLCEDVNLLLKKREQNSILLTRRERELLKLITEGYTSMEIADKLCISYETVRSYRKTLHLKLDAHNTAELTRIAINQRLV
jgi:DNA-binding NarL/FixJ family response regulator